ncbi:hypothetical protein BJX66DRAFT_319446 [Aspergillus keveii]|uniref:Uncharacterized protein n=1 Tax=Aspergillus keveii TaxID=714993 RepID=A0ABR4FIN8_9EURO
MPSTMPSKAATLARNGDFWRQSAASRDLALLPIVSPSQARANPFEAIKAHYEQARTICKAHGELFHSESPDKSADSFVIDRINGPRCPDNVAEILEAPRRSD